MKLFPAESAGFSNANPERLQWYSVSEGNPPTRTFVARDHETLMRYFADRHARGERLSLLTLAVAASWHGGVDFSYEITRSADDLAATAEGTPNAAPGNYVAIGKGAINCSKGTIFVWGMGTR